VEALGALDLAQDHVEMPSGNASFRLLYREGKALQISTAQRGLVLAMRTKMHFLNIYIFLNIVKIRSSFDVLRLCMVCRNRQVWR
jgi:hypothetical protein